jgi:hypothetical protein
VHTGFRRRLFGLNHEKYIAIVHVIQADINKSESIYWNDSRSIMSIYSEIIWFEYDFQTDEPEYPCNDDWAGLYPKPEEYFL